MNGTKFYKKVYIITTAWMDGLLSVTIVTTYIYNYFKPVSTNKSINNYTLSAQKRNHASNRLIDFVR